MATERAHGVDPAGLATFRIAFGAVMVAAVIRFAARGWIDELYVAPDFHFTYLGFDWVRPWPGFGMHLHFALMALSAALVMLGLFTRVSALVFCLCFTWAELLEKAAYLNHYYLVSLLAFLLVLAPSEACWSLDARFRGKARPVIDPLWYAAFRWQVGLVYVFAGLAKLDADWLLRGEPLGIWLKSFTDVPVVGPLFAQQSTAIAMSWAGALFDCSIVFFLAWPKTRRVAYAVAAVFHITVWLLFPIGVFSFVMLVAATVFFAPSWPRRVKPQLPAVSLPRSRPIAALVVVHLVVQSILPLRHVAFRGETNWTDEASFFAWRVMLVEKSGQVEFEVHEDGVKRLVFPREQLTQLQYRMMATSPDMIHTYAQHLADDARASGKQHVSVFAHAYCSLNGRPSQRLIDPAVDLAATKRTLTAQSFIVPLER